MTVGVADGAPLFDVDMFVQWCTAQIATGVDYTAYATAFGRVADHLFPPPPAGNLRDDPDLRHRLAHCMARAIWKQTPHPAHRYAPAPLPAAERNAPCHCGSGRKYKQCCQPIERGIPFERMNLLPHLLDALPKRRWRELVGSRIALDMVAHAAQEWNEEDRHADATALLELWLADDAHFDAHHELLFDLLLDAYTNRPKPRKKAALLDRALAHGDRRLRSAALQRRASMLADEGDYDRAWTLFAEAQRNDPESPSLSHLEVTLLFSQGREAEARERARFWVRRFERQRDPEFADLIQLLRDLADGGNSALLRVVAAHDPNVAEFLELWQAAPPIAAHYSLGASGGSAGPLAPTRALSAALQAWETVLPDIAYSPLQGDSGSDFWRVAPDWLSLLRRQPILWNAFEVLDALVEAVKEIPTPATDDLVDALLQRGEHLLREVVRTNRAGGLKFEWGWLPNRPALRLLGARIARELDAAPTPDHLARLEWLVRTLNPNDNQGFRSHLLRRYLELDRYADALAFADLYPDDFAAMRYGRALALFALGRLGEATQALVAAADESPKPLAWLLKSTAKAPRQSPFGIRVGGDDEAWIYRLENLDVWQRLGALDWARAVSAARRKR